MRRSFAPPRVAPVLLALLAGATMPVLPRAGCVARAELLSGFESGADLQRWSAIGTLEGQRLPVPAAPDDEPLADGPAGSGARLITPGRSGFFLKAGELPPDLARFDTLRFWVYRDPGAGDPAAAAASTIEVRFYEAEGGAHFWREVVLDHTGWRRVEVPLKWVRWSDTRIPRWTRVNRLGIYFRDAADIVVDSFSLDDDPPPNGPAASPDPDPDDIARIAFGAAADTDRVRVTSVGPAVIITDAPDLDPDALAAHLGRVAEAVATDLPCAGAPVAPVMVVVFADEEAYRRFPGEFAAVLGGVVRPTQAGGFTIHGIATSSWHPRYGTLRPVYTHEFIHALLSATLHLDNKSEWFQEGMATHYQLRFHPQAGLAAEVLRSLGQADEGILREVGTGKGIPLDRYWVAGTLCRMLLEDPDLAPRLPAAVAQMQKTGSTALEPLLPVLGVSWAELETRWRDFCRASFGGPAASR